MDRAMLDGYGSRPTLPRYRIGACRLLIREHEYLSANFTNDTRILEGHVIREQPKRLIYAEMVNIDTALIGGPSTDTGTTVEE